MEASAAQVPVRLVPQSSSNGSSIEPKDAPLESPAADAPAESARVLERVEIPSRYRVSPTTLAALATAAGVAAVVLGAWAFVATVREPSTTEVIRTAPISGSAQAVSLLAKPTTQRLPLRNSKGALTLAVTPAGRGVLVVDGLAVAPVGLVYQAWVLDPAEQPREPIPAGAFTGAETAVALTARVPAGWFLGVTVEPSAGEPKPSEQYRFGINRPPAG